MIKDIKPVKGKEGEGVERDGARGIDFYIWIKECDYY